MGTVASGDCVGVGIAVGTRVGTGVEVVWTVSGRPDSLMVRAKMLKLVTCAAAIDVPKSMVVVSGDHAPARQR